MKLMAGVDLVIGPLLTLLILNPTRSRKEIITVISIIAILQISALSWGLNTVYHQRPLAISYSKGNFYPIYEDAMKDQELEKGHFEQLSTERLPIIYTRPAQSAEEQQGEIAWALTKNLNSWELSFLHQSINQGLNDIKSHSLKPESLYSQNQTYHQLLDDLAAQYNITPSQMLIVPFIGKYTTDLLILNPEGRLLTSIPKLE